jgi:ABC-type lipoprotein export system ATPase subunit
MTSQSFPRGSEWHKWDLHVHTPDSLVHHYPSTDAWESFIAGLEALPPEFAVIGINDYIFIDGYRKVLDYKARGRLANIRTFLPVVELRLSMFGGTAGALQRANYHVIFSDELHPDVIQEQFLNTLSSGYALSPDHKGKTWSGVVSRSSLTDLGNLIIDSVPVDKRGQFGAPLIEGFNNLCLDIEKIATALRSPYFAHKYFTAVGKTEWANIKWNEQSIGEKKTLINEADFVFISADGPDSCIKARDSLKAAGVNHRLLDCSDAHALAAYKTKDRLGKCYTWIKASPSFAGLRQLRHHIDGRLHLGEDCPFLQHVRNNSTQYMKTLHFKRVNTANEKQRWFDGDVQLNPGLVAIIGNKGSGKSALADILAHVGRSKAYAHYSFLSTSKFLHPRLNLGQLFEGTITWESMLTSVRRFDEKPSGAEPELVKYIPQNYLESICTELKTESDTAFDKELREVIFSHVSSADKLQRQSLSELLTYLAESKMDQIHQLTTRLSALNLQIVGLNERATAEHRHSIEASLKLLKDQLDAHQRAEPALVAAPTQDASVQSQSLTIGSEIQNLASEATRLDADIARNELVRTQSAMIVASGDRLLGRLANLERHIQSFHNDSTEDSKVVGVDSHIIFTYDVDSRLIDDAKSAARARDDSARNQLDVGVAGSAMQLRKSISDQLTTKRQQLDEPSRKHQEYLHAHALWVKQRDKIIGGKDIAGSIVATELSLKALDEIPQQIGTITATRNDVALEIFALRSQLLADYQRLYAPVQDFIDNHPISREHGGLKLVASMAVDGFAEGLLGFIHQGKRGSFSGEVEGRNRIRDLVLSADLSSSAGAHNFLEEIDRLLHNDVSQNPPRVVPIGGQLRQYKTANQVYDYVYGLSYIRPRFELRWNDKQLDQLSPGERGALLLLFYLLIDKRSIPLIIDQPEENLDNRTVATLLVPAIKHARKRRQIVIVTHNPNLAVYCDADQVIYASIDKTDGNAVTYTSGPVEDKSIAQRIVDVLEGTKPAFDFRDATYDVLEAH